MEQAGDIGDARPPLNPGVPSPLHKIGLVRLGMPLIDVANVEDLAGACAELSRYSFLLTIAPPRVHGLTGIAVRGPSLGQLWARRDDGPAF